jgi:hypothetical protein
VEVFGDLFRGVRAHGSLFGSSALSPPWVLHFVDGAPLTLCTALGGAGWIVMDDHPPELLGDHEAVVVRGPGTFTFVDSVGTGAEPIACGEQCAVPEHGGTRFQRGWWSAQQDPVVGEALRSLHADPAVSWTVSSLAHRTGGVAVDTGQTLCRSGR